VSEGGAPVTAVETERLRWVAKMWDEQAQKLMDVSMKAGEVSLSLPQAGIYFPLQPPYEKAVRHIMSLFQQGAAAFANMSRGLLESANIYDDTEVHNATSFIGMNI
jgi:hypothetical protein